MAVVIRLSRQGHRHLPLYRIAVADSRKAATGKFLQHIGFYDPNQSPPVIRIDEESALKWMKTGARPTDTVRALFHRQGLMERFALVQGGKAIPETASKPRAWEKKPAKVHKKAREAQAKEAAAAPAAAAT